MSKALYLLKKINVTRVDIDRLNLGNTSSYDNLNLMGFESRTSYSKGKYLGGIDPGSEVHARTQSFKLYVQMYVQLVCSRYVAVVAEIDLGMCMYLHRTK